MNQLVRTSPVSPRSRRPTLSPDAGGGRETLLVYRHRLAPLSEASFLSRFYAGFEHLTPTWLGYHLDAGVNLLPGDTYHLGRPGVLGVLDRTLFRHAGILPPQPDLRTLHPRLIHAHFGPGGAFALPIARALGVPLVVTFHGADVTKDTHYRSRMIPRTYARRLEALQREAALFVCVSEFVRDTCWPVASRRQSSKSSIRASRLRSRRRSKNRPSRRLTFCLSAALWRKRAPPT